jgi:hypothetical protein
MVLKLSCRAAHAAYSLELQWTKLRPGATVQCNVDRFNGCGLTG